MTFDFQSEFDRAWGHVTERLGEQDATFTPTGGDPISLAVLLVKETVMQPSGGMSESWGMITTIEMNLSDLDGVEPDKGDRIVVGTDAYQVHSVLENNGYSVKVQV
jgi:hypothetical protein